MSRSLRVPKDRPRGSGGIWTLVFVVTGITILAVIWAKRRAQEQERQPVGTAPAGAPPMPERDPAARAASLVARPTPTATPGTTTGAVAGATTAPAGPDVARQPAPIAEADAPGTASPERLATAGPDMAAWIGGLASDTSAAAPTDETTTASPATSESTATDEAGATARAEGDSTDETGTEEIPTPAAETTEITATEGKDWIEANGAKSCPPEFPIKGNATSRIYHLPGEPTYEATVPELCFATEEAAVGLGYRARKR